MINVLDLDRPGLSDFFLARGEKRYRADQVFQRLHRGGATTVPQALADLPQAARQEISADVSVQELPLASDHQSADGTHKLLFAINERERIEAVIIPEARRTTLCVSSQAGCALACRFCLTGQQGFSRNLRTSEIISQLRCANRILAAAGDRRITNVVMMGMGEPLLNADAVFPALRMMTDVRGFALPSRRVTVSTAGVLPAIRRLRDECQVSLAVSLHAPTDALRDELMPINRKYPLAALMDACRDYLAEKAKAHITFEYVMLDGINDGDADAKNLARLLRGVRNKVNLIPFNPFPGAAYTVSPMSRIVAFRDRLMQSGVMTTIRKTRGDDILAACGQLAGDVKARTYGLGARPLPLRR